MYPIPLISLMEKFITEIFMLFLNEYVPYICYILIIYVFVRYSVYMKLGFVYAIWLRS